ncbi:hypothetical protein ACFYUV_04985 [Nonomuraea sp. NPDC003560]|uniref:hypothetical protein n=1 Tax=Nonomuraea sp. NPDC003560 TaxID=3364341 RepID=UPI0036C56B67
MTLFAEPDASVQVAWPNVLLLILAELVVAWALGEFLHGPLTGPLAEQDRDAMRLRVVLSVAAASVLVTPFLTTWSPWVAVVTFAPMLGVVLLLSPALGGTRRHVLILRVSGALGYGCAAVGLGLALAGHAVGALALVAGLASLIWNVLAPRAQWDNNRFQRATVKIRSVQHGLHADLKRAEP